MHRSQGCKKGFENFEPLSLLMHPQKPVPLLIVTSLIQPPLWPRNVHNEVSDHLLQEPRTPHKSDRSLLNQLLYWLEIPQVVQIEIFLSDCSICGCNDVLMTISVSCFIDYVITFVIKNNILKY